MTLREFRQRCADTGIKATSPTGVACKLIMVNGKSVADTGVDKSALSRALALLRRVTPAEVCPHCARRL